MVQDLQVDVQREVEMSRQAVETVRPLPCRQGAGQHVDAIERDDSDNEVAADFEPRLARVLRQSMRLSPMRDAHVQGKKQSESQRACGPDPSAGLGAGRQDWLDIQIFLTSVSPNPAGGDRVADIEPLERDEGFATVLRSIGKDLLSRADSQAMKGRRGAWGARDVLASDAFGLVRAAS